MVPRFQRVIGLLLSGVLVVIAGVGLLAPEAVRALTLPNGAAATLVLGQSTFSESAPDTTQNRFYAPQDVAVDPVSGKVFVSDTLNNRVLRFARHATLGNGAAAEVVLGQATFLDNTSACAATRMTSPGGITVDSAGALWVADSGGNRVLRFDDAATLSSGAGASGVLGQPDLTTCDVSEPPTASSLNVPGDVAVDSAGRLWVVDIGGNRVLRFDHAASKADGAAADGVLGQNTFGSSAADTTQSSFRQPLGVAVDASGTLWVADTNNSRVLRFDGAAAKANGANADGVLGQSTFTGFDPGTGTTGVSYPALITVEPASGRLWVVDPGSNRVLRFDNAAAKANGANADGVLGQSTFSGTGAATSATALTSPFGVGYDATLDVVWVADAGNSRVLMFGMSAAPTFTPTFTPTSAVPTFTPTNTPSGTPAGTITSTPSSTATTITTSTPTGTSMGTSTATGTMLPTSSSTATGTPISTITATPTGTNTGTPTALTPTSTITPTATAPVLIPRVYLPIVRVG